MTLMSASGFGKCHDCGEEFASCECEWRPDLRDRLGREPCCSQDYGGSHYHCARCGAVTGMYGHYTTGVMFDGKWLKLGKETIDLPDGKTAEIDRGLFSCTDEYDEALAALGLERIIDADGRKRGVRRIEAAA